MPKPRLGGGFARFHQTLDFGRFRSACCGEVVTALQVQPELGRAAEVPRETQRGVCGDTAPSTYDFIEPGRIDGEAPGELIDAQAKRLQQFLFADFAGMNGGRVSSFFGIAGSFFRMVVRDFDPKGVRFGPDEADAVLIVDLSDCPDPPAGAYATAPVAAAAGAADSMTAGD